MTFGQKLVIIRKNKSITQSELANALNVSRQSIHKWESGRCYPEVTKLILIKKIFDVSIDDLLNDDFEISDQKKMIKK